MRKSDLFIGMVIGLFSSLIGSYLFVIFATDYTFLDGIAILKANNNLGKLITLGAVLNLIVFFALLHYKKELMARGVVLATILLTILTIFI